MALPAENPQSPTNNGHRAPSRESVSQRRRKRALDLEQELRFLADKYTEPAFFEVIQEAITSVHNIAERSRTRDRDRVMYVMEQWDCLTREEIVEETELSSWVVRQILKDLEDANLLGTKKQDETANPEGGRPVTLYFLLHST